MLQELAARTGASAWAIASMFFFIVVWAWIAVRTFRASADDMDANARLALDADDVSAADGRTRR